MRERAFRHKLCMAEVREWQPNLACAKWTASPFCQALPGRALGVSWRLSYAAYASRHTPSAVATDGDPPHLGGPAAPSGTARRIPRDAPVERSLNRSTIAAYASTSSGRTLKWS